MDTKDLEELLKEAFPDSLVDSAFDGNNNKVVAKSYLGVFEKIITVRYGTYNGKPEILFKKGDEKYFYANDNDIAKDREFLIKTLRNYKCFNVD